MVLEIFNPWYRPKDDFEPLSFVALFFRAPVKLLLYHAYHLLACLRSTPKPTQPPIRVVCISDTHNRTLDHIPPGDILIHAGDLTSGGSVAEIQKQIDWLASLPHKEIIVTSGNHDTYLDPRTRSSLPEEQRRGGLDWKRLHYLQHRRVSLTIDADFLRSDTTHGARTALLTAERCQRRLRIYGAPQVPACGPGDVHAFQYPRSQDAWSDTVPEDVDILVTHTPPKYHLDLSLSNSLGCEHLLSEVTRVKPTLHVFGHVHWGAGKTVVWWDKAHDAYVRGLSLESKWSHGLLNPRLWWNVVRVLYRGIRELLWDRVWGGQSANTIMINAAQMRGNTGNLGNPVQVVDI